MSKIDSDESFYRLLVENARDVITVVDSNGIIEYQSNSLFEQFGYKPDELIGRNVFDYLHPDDIEQSIASLGGTFSGAPEAPGESRHLCRFRHKQQHWVYIEVIGNRLNHGNKTSVMLQSQDVTIQQEALRSLRESEAAFSAAFDATSVFCSITVPETGRFLQVNDAWVRTLGWSRAEALGKTADEMNIWGTPENRARVLAAMDTEGEIRQRRVEIYNKAGKKKIATMDAKLLNIQGVQRLFISAVDITDRELLEEKLRQSQKMEAIGQLTGGIAHDFNNMLSVIIGNAELVGFEKNLSADAISSIDAIMKASLSGADLIKQLMAFSRKLSLHPTAFDMGQRILELRQVLQSTLGKDVELSISTPDTSADVNLDPNQFDSAILNLVLNAKHAMPSGGKLQIDVGRVSLRGDGNTRVQVNAGDYIQISVADTGIGMSPEDIEKACEPFFTTRMADGGSGLGLSMVYGFTRQSGGQLIIESRVSLGTTVRLQFPVAGATVQKQSDHESHPENSYLGKRAILIEDNAEVRALIFNMLSVLGIHVLQASDAEEAYAIVTGPLDLLVTDVMLPGEFKGPDIVEHYRELNPSLSVLYVSGFQTGVINDGELSKPSVGFLQKPFSRNEFSAQIDLLLGTKTGAMNII